MSGMDASVDLSTTGEHTLETYMREDGLRVDRLLLVTDTNYIPSGLGPAESPFDTITKTIPGSLGTTSISYGYDPLYRLTDAAYTGAITATFTYVYDSVGNMTAFTETVDAQTTIVTRTFDGANRLEYAVDASGTTTYTYDANGNLVELLPPGATVANPVGGLRYAYDQRNLMVGHETNPDGTAWALQAQYVYDGANDRLQQVDYTGATPITTTYTNDIFGLTQVLVADDGINQVYNLFGLDLISQDSGSEVRTLLVDGLGSVRTEMAGSVVEAATTHTPYGEVLEQTGTSGTVYGFTGEQEDSATGLLYLRARYYSPYLNRFLSADTIVPDFRTPQNLNLHAYVNNNPVNWVDPSGHARIKVWVSAFISPPSVQFPLPYGDNLLISDTDATFEGDDRSFYRGGAGRPSARVWHEVILDTDDPLFFVKSNKSDTGVTRASWQVRGWSYYATGKAPKPSPASIGWIGEVILINVEVKGESGANPLALSGVTPPIRYRYGIRLDLAKGEVMVVGYHGWYPWHEVYLEVDGSAVNPPAVNYTPIGSVWPENPAALTYPPQPIQAVRLVPELKSKTVPYCVYPTASTLAADVFNETVDQWAWLTLLNTNDLVPGSE